VVFTGSATDAVQVGFRENGVLLVGVAVGSNGTGSWESGWSWSPGKHVVDVFAVHASGAESPVTQLPFTVMDVASMGSRDVYYGGIH
jgi:hypothetical protein